MLRGMRPLPAHIGTPRATRFGAAAIALIAIGACGDGEDIVVAELLDYEIRIAAGELARTYWLPLPGEAILVHEDGERLVVRVESIGGQAVETIPASLPDGVTDGTLAAIRLAVPAGRYFLTFERADPADNGAIEAELALVFTDTTLFSEASIEGGGRLGSPLLTYPAGDEVRDVPAGEPDTTFADFVRRVFGYSVDEIPLALYLGTELNLLACALPVAGAAPTGIAGPQPPFGARHNDEFCGLSVFIHSLQQYFPTALPADIAMARGWDAVGDAIDHSNTFGERGCKLVDEVNRNYRDGTAAADSVKYCAVELDDTSLANLQAWTEDCNLKLLVYDLPAFGHWVDVVAIRADTLDIQDYGRRYDAPYNADDENVDFSMAGGSAMGMNFDASNPVAGDALDEIVDFYVVCRCDIVGGEARLPTRTRSGRTLNP